MARAYTPHDDQDQAQDSQPGEWQALRGELVALLDQVEGRYGGGDRRDPALSGLSQRVRNLREQVVGPEPTVRHREALRTVKRAVDRFSERDETAPEPDALQSAIAEIRSRQFSAPAAALGRRVTDAPEFRELTALVGGLSGRLEQLESQLKSRRNSNEGGIAEVASQVEQLTHVVELLAGAVGETGQVKRLEAQIAALARMMGEAPKVDLSAVNARLDDVSATVGKLAELQAQQMEREILRQDRETLRDEAQADVITPIEAIEKGVRNIYDRIDVIERSVAMSSADFERLTSEMSALTQAMRDRDAAPDQLVQKLDALAYRVGSVDSADGNVLALREDIAALRDTVAAGMEPRFSRLESRIDALSEKLGKPQAPQAATGQIESQLKLLMARMDETGAQLNGLAKLYSAPAEASAPDYDALANMVAEKTSRAVARSVPATAPQPAPDFEALADMVAERASRAVAKAAPAAAPQATEISAASIDALEKRMTALLNTAGRDTAERLARLETALTGRNERPASASVREAPVKPASTQPLAEEHTKLDAMLMALSMPKGNGDAMPINPIEDAPLTDRGFADVPMGRPDPQSSQRKKHPGLDETSSAPPPVQPPRFDPNAVERPPRPQSSFADPAKDPFVPEPAIAIEAIEPAAATSTSTFVAAARRAQRAKQETQANTAGSNSAIGRALARVMPGKPAAEEPAVPEVAPAVDEKPAKAKKVKPPKAEKPEKAKPLPELDENGEPVVNQSFFVRHRRPLLLTAALVAVSMLALNLVMQRMNEANSAPTSAEVAPDPALAPAAMSPLLDEATPSAATAMVQPSPRVIDMLDSSAVTASINPSAPMAFSKPVATTPMPPPLLAGAEAPATIAPLDVPATAPIETGSIQANAAAPEVFELPPEALGPLELREAAAKGDARAQFEVGAIYTEGRALPQDYKEAAIWYERAAAQGFVPAQYRLGNLYEVGQGVEKDLEQAKLWYQRGAEAGNRMAMHNLAALYASGQLGDQQFENAAQWFEQAANRGMTDSQFNLGMLYARGLGVEQNLEKSYKWFALAARSGDADAAQARDDIGRSLSADAVKSLGTEVDGWKAEPVDLAANFAPIGTWTDAFDPGETIKTRDVIAKVQDALRKLGYDVGTSDGMAGPKTAEAIKAFERGTGMSELGLVNPRLLAVLGSQPV